MKWADTSREWKPFFCLLPRRIEGVIVWLERVEVRQSSYDPMLGAGYSFRLPAPIVPQSLSKED